MEPTSGKRWIVPILLALLVSACARYEPPVATPYPYLHSPSGSEIPESIAIRQLLLSHFNGWEGTPYRFGGSSRSGIDCSAYTSRLFKDVFNLSLNRTVRLQRKQGERIDPAAIRAGDLVFFNARSYPHHVGVALGDGRFIHVSSKQGVMISPLHTGYWQPHFTEARRIVDYLDSATSANPSRNDG